MERAILVAFAADRITTSGVYAEQTTLLAFVKPAMVKALSDALGRTLVEARLDYAVITEAEYEELEINPRPAGRRLQANKTVASVFGEDARVTGYVLVTERDAPEQAGGAAVAAAGGGSSAAAGGGGGALAAGRSADPVILHCIESVFAVLDDSGQPVCCGFFISPLTALTIYHDSKPSIGATMQGQRFDPVDGSHRGERLHLITERVSARLDVVLLRLAEGQPPAEHFLSVPAPRAAVSLLGQRVAVVGLGIPAAVHAAEEPGELFAGLSWQSTDVVRVGKAHFVYCGTFGPGDSGSALILAGHEVVGMHLAGWNYAPEGVPPVAEDEAEWPDGAAAAGGGLAADLKRMRAEDRVVAVLGESATKSVAASFAKLAGSITVGGWAVSLVSPAFGAFLA